MQSTRDYLPFPSDPKSLVPFSPKSGEVSYALCLYTGIFGGQRFYAGKITEGLLILVLSLLTGGFVGAVTLLWDAWQISHNKFKDNNGQPIKFLTSEGKWPKSALLATAGLLVLIGGSMASGGLASLIIGVGAIVTGISCAAIAAKRFLFERKPSSSASGSDLTKPFLSSNQRLDNQWQHNPTYNPGPLYTPPAPSMSELISQSQQNPLDYATSSKQVEETQSYVPLRKNSR